VKKLFDDPRRTGLDRHRDQYHRHGDQEAVPEITEEDYDKIFAINAKTGSSSSNSRGASLGSRKIVTLVTSLLSALPTVFDLRRL